MGGVTWAYFELIVFCILWIIFSYFKYMFWRLSIFQSTCEELALMRYSFTLLLATTVVIFHNIHHSQQFCIQFNLEDAQASTELFSNENMTSWFLVDDWFSWRVYFLLSLVVKVQYLCHLKWEQWYLYFKWKIVEIIVQKENEVLYRRKCAIFTLAKKITHSYEKRKSSFQPKTWT